MSHRHSRFQTRLLSCSLLPALLLLPAQRALAAEEHAAPARQEPEAPATPEPPAIASQEAEAPAPAHATAEQEQPKESPSAAHTKANNEDTTEPVVSEEPKQKEPHTEAPAAHETPADKTAHAETPLSETVPSESLHEPKSEKANEKVPEKMPLTEAAPEAKAKNAHAEKQPAGAHAAEKPHEKSAETGHATSAKDSHEKPAAAGHAAPAKDAHEKHTEGGHEAGAKDAHGEAGAHEENKEVPAEIMTMQATELFKYSDKAYEDGRYDTAQIGYRQLLSLRMPKAQIRAALLGFGRSLKKQGELTKAVAVFERLIKDFPAEMDTPEIYLELGRCQRALGAYKTAINRFYSVLNSTIKLTEDGAAKYRQLAKTAQFEIAETYFIAGDYKEAQRFYSRLRLLDLNPTDRARAHFKAAYAQQLGGDILGSITQLRSFIELNPEDENVPEARYLIAMGLRSLGRSQESLFEALELLRTERTRTSQDPKRWAYWQRKTGNQIANEFYNQGDTNSALMIYLSLVELSSDPAWRAPMLYQIALCQERQGRKDKAIENYKSILDIAAAQKGDDPRKADFAELARMATWRLSQIEWVHNAEQRLNTLLPNIEAEGQQPPSAPPATK